MQFRFYITVHVYAEEELNDQPLTLHSRNYGLLGKEIIAPLRKINCKEFCIKNVQETFTVAELWDYINSKLYNLNTSQFINEYNVLEKYLIFNDLRYTVQDTTKPLHYFLQMMGITDQEIINVQILVSSDAGTIFKDDGIRYYMPSNESGSHNLPHVHVDIRHEYSASFSLVDGSQLAGDTLKKKDTKKIQRMIEEKRSTLYVYWQEHTSGLTVDLNQALGLIHY